MRITIRNNTQLPNKYVRFIKWKLYAYKAKFPHLIYSDVFINVEGQTPKTYSVSIRLGILGNDIIIQNKSEDLKEILKKSTAGIHRYLVKSKPSNHKRGKILMFTGEDL